MKQLAPNYLRGNGLTKHTGIHSTLRKDLQDRVHSGNVPKKGQRKDIFETEGHSEGHPGQQLPITCLLIICKFLPGIMGEMLNQHVETKGLLVDEHKGSRKETRGKKCLR